MPIALDARLGERRPRLQVEGRQVQAVDGELVRMLVGSRHLRTRGLSRPEELLPDHPSSRPGHLQVIELAICPQLKHDSGEAVACDLKVRSRRSHLSLDRRPDLFEYLAEPVKLTRLERKRADA